MSKIWNQEKLWSHAETTLRKCDAIIEKLVDCDGMPTSQCPLDEFEIKECHKAIALCGLILSRLFGNCVDPTQRLSDFVFQNDTEFAEKAIVAGNRAYIRACDEEEIELDKQHEIADRVRRGIAWLDTRDELGTWEPCITKGNFKLADPCNCVGGNIFGEAGDTRSGENGFKRLCSKLAEIGLNPIDLGFASNGEPGDTAALQKEWISQVGERL